MKTNFTFLFFFLLVLSSCTDSGEVKKLSEIENLKTQYPDSALFLLETYFTPSVMNDKTLGRWCLLSGALCDSLEKPIDISPDLLERVVEYYKHENAPNLQARAYYYLGRAFYDRKDYNRAMEAYVDAINIAQKADEHNLAGYIYNGMADIHRQRSDVEKTMRYHEQASNRVWEIKDGLRTAELTKKYDYSKIVEENILLAYESRNRLMWIFFCLTICLVICVVYQYNVLKKNKELQRKHQEIEFEKNKEREQELKMKEQELEFKEKALSFRKQKDELEMKINRETETKQGLLKGSLMFKKINMLSEFSTRHATAFRAEVEKVMSTSTLSEDDWRDIKNEINNAYPDFTVKILQEIPTFTEEEIRFCCLLKVGMETSELAVLLNITSQSVNKRRARINKKIREVYPNSSWGEYLYNI